MWGNSIKRKLLLSGAVLTAGIALTAPQAGAAVSTSESGWFWGNPTPQGETLRAISFVGGVGYAIGDSGSALKTTDGGASWIGLATGTAGALERLQVLDPATVVLSGGNGCILRRSTDGGKTFTRIFTVAESGCTDKVRGFSFVNAQTGFVMLTDGAILRTQDGGQSFARLTAVPSTAASSGGGANGGMDIHFSDASHGVAFVGPAQGGTSAYVTSDGAGSWQPLSTVDPGQVRQIHFVDAKNAYAIGPATLLRTTDAGVTWKQQPIAGGNDFKSIDCADANTCAFSLGAGDRLLRTSDGGQSASATTPSSAAIYAAAYATATRIVAVGARGTTVISGDGGQSFGGASADIGGSYGRLRSGPGSIVYAPGQKGIIARSDDGGASWRALATQTQAQLIDASFATPQVGYALDESGGLQQTGNGGLSWRTLDPGTSRPARAVRAFADGSVLLVGPVGISRSVNGGRFNSLPAKIVRRASLGDVNVAGAAVFAYGPSTLLRSSNAGAVWKQIKLPTASKKSKKALRIKSVSFVDASHGFVLTQKGRLFRTANGGRTWKESSATGTSGGQAISFGDALHGFETIGAFGDDSSSAYVLRTGDGGASWHPQLIANGTLFGVLASGANNAFGLVQGTGGEPRELFFTNSGGDAGQSGALAITTKHRALKAAALRKARGKIAVTGTLGGAQGGEKIVVSRLQKGNWSQQTVTAGANGGSFTTNWKISGSAAFVAQWAGGSGRSSLGTRPLKVNVR